MDLGVNCPNKRESPRCSKNSNELVAVKELQQRRLHVAKSVPFANTLDTFVVKQEGNGPLDLRRQGL